MTLVELLLSMAIVVVTATLAAPRFTAFMNHLRLTTTTHQLFRAIVITRSEAIRRQRIVELRAIDGNWNNGWMTLTGETEIGQVHPALATSVRVISRLSDGKAHIAFDGSGRSCADADHPTPQFGRIQVSDGDHSRSIVINFLGRTRICRSDLNGQCLPESGA